MLTQLESYSTLIDVFTHGVDGKALQDIGKVAFCR